MDLIETLATFGGATVEVFFPSELYTGTLLRAGDGSFDVRVSGGDEDMPTAVARATPRNVGFIRVHVSTI
ncbi:hypothetical protein [Paenibacillus xerothermodurans]|uniref:Uncharacterized protein n=1 Tax=Paenibacillus xerothermodurans TaxID=1977292 RepID=A0A2W1NNW6_PAEXE|nr:hypothetical protein [Paenibacillus xerothermodurans]PZE20613.1 hypothetical protein CBW46_012665 [Paenibacillus xerothermodurans]